jgi:DNA-binding response OmpR family regulator
LNKLRLIPGGTDAVIVDLGLPDRSGDALIAELRSIYPSMPVIIASGRGADDLRERFKGIPSISFVSKPYNAEGLRAAMRAIGIY